MDPFGAILKDGYTEATIDIRVLPDEDVTRFYDDMRRVIGDAAVQIVPIVSSRPVAPPSGLGTEMYRALEQAGKREYPGSTAGHK